MQSPMIRTVLSLCLAYTRVHSDICIKGTSRLNEAFYGNYIRASIPDAYGNIYYEKQQTYEEQQDCQLTNKPEYLYLNLYHEWQTNYILNDASSFLKCSYPSGTPEQCPPNTWHNGGNIDATITVSNIPCPPIMPNLKVLSCMGSITIESRNPRCSGVFNQIDIGLYHKNGDCGAYFYYNPHRKLWECGPQNRKDYCLAERGGPSTFYWRSESDRIETLRNGETISVPLANPAGETAIITCGGVPVFTPTISCNFIELKYSGNCQADGIYSTALNRPNLYTKIEGNSEM